MQSSIVHENVKDCDHCESIAHRYCDICAWEHFPSEENDCTSYESNSFSELKSKETMQSTVLIEQRRTDPPDRLVLSSLGKCLCVA